MEAPTDAILTFHSIDESGGVLSCPERELARLLDGLVDDGVAIVPLSKLSERPADARPRVALTFDDGIRSVRTAALPLLKARSLPFTLFVVSDFVGRDNGWPSQQRGIPRLPLLDWSELAELRDAGAEIGGHTASHVPLRDLGEAEWTRELADSKKVLEDRLGVAVTSFAYPYGIYDDEAVRRVGSRYARAVTTRLAYVQRGEEPCRLPRLDAWYLKPASRWRPLFGGRARAMIAVRAFLRSLRGGGYGS